MGWAEPIEHDVDGREVDHRFAILYMPLVVLAQASVSHQPAERSLHNPTSWEQHKTLLIFRTLHDFHVDVVVIAHPVNKFTPILLICPHLFESVGHIGGDQEEQHAAIPIFHVPRRHDDRQQRPDGVNDHMALSSLDLLAPIVPTFAARFGCFRCLTVNGPSTGGWGSSLFLSDLLTEGFVHYHQCAVLRPFVEVVAHTVVIR